jgi:hypothetical protein
MGACSTTPSPRTPGMEAMSVEMTSAELSLDLYRYESLFASMVQTTANDIYEETENMAIRKTAICWKINAIPDIQATVFRLDPLSGLADAFGFTAQMEQFVAEGAGKCLFGEQQHLAINASRFLMSEVRGLAVSVVGQQRLNEVEPRYTAWGPEIPDPEHQFRSTLGYRERRIHHRRRVGLRWSRVRWADRGSGA